MSDTAQESAAGSDAPVATLQTVRVWFRVKRLMIGLVALGVLVVTAGLLIGLAAEPQTTRDWLADLEQLRLDAQPEAGAEANGWNALMSASASAQDIAATLEQQWIQENFDNDLTDHASVRRLLSAAEDEVSDVEAARRRLLVRTLAERGVYDEIHRAAAQPRVTMPYTDAVPAGAPVAAMNVPTGELFFAGQILRARGFVAAADGDWTSVTDIVSTLLRLAEAQWRQATAVEHVAGFGFLRHALDLTRRAANDPVAPASTLAELAQLLRNRSAPPPVERFLDGERVLLGAVFDATHTSWGMLMPSTLEDHVPNAAPSLFGMRWPAALDAAGLAYASKQHGLDVADVIFTDLKAMSRLGSDAERSAADGRIWRSRLPINRTRFRYVILDNMLPVLGATVRSHAAARQASDAVQLLLAATQYTREHGEPPPDAATLVPTYLDRVPTDLRIGEPMTLDAWRPDGE